MKFIKLLHKQLKGIWSYSGEYASQDGDKDICFYRNRPNYKSEHDYWHASGDICDYIHRRTVGVLAEDYKTAIITKDEYMNYVKSLESKTPDWHNTGNIPPVGTKCWICWEDGSERKAEITAIGKEKFMALVDAWGSEIAMTKQGLKFKEIRSEQDIAVEELEKHIADNASLTNYGLALELYKLGYRKQ